MPAKSWEYDVFISYSRDDGAWVKEYLYEPLLRSRRKVDGAPPRVFFDVSEEGVAVAAGFIEALGAALQSSHRFLLVYSRSYFEKPMCRWERHLALPFDPTGDAGRIIPVLKDSDAAKSVPFVLTALQYVRTGSGDWFGRVCENLDLRPDPVPPPQPVLQIIDSPRVAELNRPLPPVRVTVEGIGTGAEPVEVSLSAEGGSLQGVLCRPVSDGEVVFDDLAVADAGATVSLVAEVRGVASVSGPPIAVRRHEPPAPLPRSVSTLAVAGATHAVFLRDGASLVVVGATEALLAGVSGGGIEAPTARVKIDGPVRGVFRGRDRALVAQWDGTVHLLCGDGRANTWSPPDDDGALHVPGDVAVADGEILVGYWEGSVYRFLPGGDPPAKVLRCLMGVRRLAVFGDEILAVEFDDGLSAYRGGKLVNKWHLEPHVVALWGRGRHTIVVGRERIHRLDVAEKSILSEPVGLPDVASVLTDSERPVIVGSDGKAFRFDADVVKSPRFYVPPGSRAVGADDVDHACVFALPDGTHILVRDGVTVLEHREGCLSVSPDGRWVALGDANGLRIVSQKDLRAPSGGGTADA